MSILVINCGSSSIKAALFHRQTQSRLLDIRVNDLGSEYPTLSVNQHIEEVSASDHQAAIGLVFESVVNVGYSLTDITGVGHRVVHGGDSLTRPTVIDSEVEAQIAKAVKWAPLQNQACLNGIRASREILPQCPQVAVFDTGFHAKLSTRAKLYALPEKMTFERGYRRYGFHGINHEYVCNTVADHLGKSIRELNFISCHLGGGCAIASKGGA